MGLPELLSYCGERGIRTALDLPQVVLGFEPF